MAPLRFTAARSLRCASFTVNVGAPLVTPGTPPRPRHDGRFIAARSLRCMFIAAWDDAARFRCGGSRCALPGTGRHEWRPYGSPLPRVHCRTFPLHRAGFTVIVGAPPRTPGTPPHPRHDGRFIAERFRCRAFIAPRRFAPSNVGAPPRTPGTPPHPRHDGRVHRSAFVAVHVHCSVERRGAFPLRRFTLCPAGHRAS